MIKADNHILVIFGASGDLTTRKLLPALFNLFCDKLLPDSFAILGVGRTPLNDTNFRNKINSSFIEAESNSDLVNSFISLLHYISIDTSDKDSYSALKAKLKELNTIYNANGNYIFYLATPPTLYRIIPEALSLHGLSKNRNGAWRRLIVEKPFGYDLRSARQLNKDLLLFFNEDQIYRIDHYLGKETVQNLMVTRFSNGIFEPLWNRNYVDHIEITSAENIGVGSRGGYYDKSGALRDMLQNHLLQLVGLIAMEPPGVNSSNAIRNETLKVFQSIRQFTTDDIRNNIIRGQYVESVVKGKKIKGYRQEEEVAVDSRTETYVAVKLFVDNWRWGGVPFYIRTGKRLPTRVTEIVIHFKATPHRIFCADENSLNIGNQLVIRIQPDEGILLKIGMKVPGAGFIVQDINMDFHYSDLGHDKLPDAYQRLLLDCMIGDSTLYARGDAVEEAWKIVDPILDFWKNNPGYQLHGYPAGTWGPNIADELIEGKNLTWRYPCRNLTNDGIYCEL